MTSTPPEQRPGGRNIAPIRWPRPEGPSVVLFAGWVAGVLVALLVPALIYHPTAPGGNSGRAITAFLVTVVGVAVMGAFAGGLYRRHRETGLLVFIVVPCGVALAGGFMFLGLKLFGAGG